MKTVLLPVHPNWLELILSGKKTVEVRKTKPKEAVPFKVLLYCTKGPIELARDKNENFVLLARNKTADISDFEILSGKVIAEFVCDGIIYLGNVATDSWDRLLGSVHEHHKFIVRNQALLTEKEMLSYGGRYGWHISDLKIYKPKKLSEFGLKRAPQSWFYVEGGE